MGHPLRKQARYLKREFGLDEELKSPSYQWCLQMAIKFWDETKGAPIAERNEKLAQLVKPHVTRAE